MQSGRSQKSAFTAECRTIIARSTKAGACASPFGSIGKDFRFPPIPNGERRRQTQRAGLRGAKIPCLKPPYNLQHFPFGNPPLAEESGSLAAIENYLPIPEKAGARMTTSSHFCGTLLSGVFLTPLRLNAVSMANPEV
jgi:hypothetical protein